MGMFGEVRSVLQRHPTHEVFQGLIELLGVQDIPQEVMVYAQEQLDEWPAHVPRMVSDKLMGALAEGEQPEAFRLCTSMDLFCFAQSTEAMRVMLRAPIVRDSIKALRIHAAGDAETLMDSFFMRPSARRIQSWSAVLQEELAQWGEDQALTTLSLSGFHLDAEVLQAWLTKVNTTQLRALLLPENIFDPGVFEALRTWAPLSQLVAFELSSKEEIDTQDLSDLLTLLPYPTLEQLSLSYRTMSSEHLDVLLKKGEAFTALRQLTLRGSLLSADYIRALLRLPGLAHLQSLDLSEAFLDDEPGGCVEALLESPVTAHLTDLALCDNCLSHDELITLVTSPALHNVSVLGLSLNDVDDEVIEVLASSPAMANLKELFVTALSHTFDMLSEYFAEPSEQDEGDVLLAELDRIMEDADALGGQSAVHVRGARALATSTTLERLEVLDLSDQPVGEEGALALLRSTHLRSLKKIHFGHNVQSRAVWRSWLESGLAPVDELHINAASFVEEGMMTLKELIASPLMAYVSELSVPDTQHDVLEALAESPHLDRLKTLEIEFDDEVAKEAGAFFARLRAPSLSMIHLSSYPVMDDDAMSVDLYESDSVQSDIDSHILSAIFSNDFMRTLRVLYLDVHINSSLSAAAFRPLVEQSEDIPLIELVLGSNPLSDEAVGALASSTCLGHLEILSVGRLSPQGAIELASLRAPHLRKLCITSLSASDDAVKALANATWCAQLEELELIEVERLRDEHLLTLLDSHMFSSLKDLTLRAVEESELSEEIVARFMSALSNSSLEGLELANMPILDHLLVDLFEANPSLSNLSLFNCGVGDEGVRAIARSPRLQSLSTLNLSSNVITEQGLFALRDSPFFDANVTIALLYDNSYGEEHEELAEELMGGGFADGEFDLSDEEMDALLMDEP